MKRYWKLMVMALVLSAVSVIYAFVPGRDVQPVEVTNTSIAVTGSVSMSLDDVTGGDTSIVVRPASGQTFPVSMTDRTSYDSQLVAIGIDIADIKLKLEDKVAKETTLLEILARLDESTYSDSDLTERVDFNPYSEVTKTYSNVMKVDIYLETAARKLRVATNGNTTAGQYFVIDKTESPGWTTGSNQHYASYVMKLMGDTADESGIAVIRIQHYKE